MASNVGNTCVRDDHDEGFDGLLQQPRQQLEYQHHLCHHHTTATIALFCSVDIIMHTCISNITAKQLAPLPPHGHTTITA